MKVIAIKKQEEILGEVRRVLWQIKTDLLYKNKTIDFEITYAKIKEKYSFLIQNELNITMDLQSDCLILYNEKYNENVTIHAPHFTAEYSRVRGEWTTIKDYFETIITSYSQQLSNEYQSLLGDIHNNHLIDYVNKYIAEQNVNYKIDNINNIDWKYLFDNITINSQFLDKLYFTMDLKDYCQYGDVIWKLIDDCDMYAFHFLFLNQKTSLQNKLEYIDFTHFDDVDYITDTIIDYRNDNGVEVDKLLISYMENNLPINIEMLSQCYPLTENIVTRFIDKLSLDNIMKNETIKNKYDIIVLFKEKINQL
jgi:hypothetical protein